jgi:hopanoid biosynthesis associated protein HpnK
MKRLIVNADDFGLADSVNGGVVAAHRGGILTSASLLANGPAFDEAAGLSRQCPELSIGVHLNISEGKPVSPAAAIATLVNAHGDLHLTPLRLWTRIVTRQVNLEHIHAEFRAQIVKVFDSGITATHLDGHLHVQVLPQLTPMLIALTREFGIHHVRSPAENLETTLPLLWKFNTGMGALKRSAIAYGVSSLARELRARLHRAGLACSDAFLGLAHTRFLNTEALGALLAAAPHGTTELMCHPGYASPQVEALGGELTREREIEVAALTALKIRQVVQSEGICLVNFRDLE